jgi:hypothetical protein
VLGGNRATVHRLRKRSDEPGRHHTFQENHRRGAPGNIGGRVEARLTRLACSHPPAGDGRWTRP